MNFTTTEQAILFAESQTEEEWVVVKPGTNRRRGFNAIPLSLATDRSDVVWRREALTGQQLENLYHRMRYQRGDSTREDWAVWTAVHELHVATEHARESSKAAAEAEKRARDLVAGSRWEALAAPPYYCQDPENCTGSCVRDPACDN